MIQRLLFVFCLIVLLTGYLTAQRTVTNADLEKYKQARLEADKDYRENYQRLGLPSPEELEKRREASRAEMDKLYEKLRADRLEEARINAIQAAANSQWASSTQYVPFVLSYSDPAYIYYPNGFYRNRYYPNRRFSRFNRGNPIGLGYVGGGQFWPSGVRSFPRPIQLVRPPRPMPHGPRR